MTLTPIEILAAIAAILILVKLLLAAALKPKSLLNLYEAILIKHGAFAMAAYLVLLVIIGYYVFSSMSMVQVVAVMFFTSILIRLSLIPYSKPLYNLLKEILIKGFFRESWLTILVLLAIAIWTLYEIFV